MSLDELNGQQQFFPFKNVLLVGVGALGSEMAKNLVLRSVSNLTIVDADIIELSNLNRQLLFRPSDQTKSKAVVAAQRLNHMFPSYNGRITVHQCVVEELPVSLLENFDLVISAVDLIETRMWLNEICHCLLHVPLLDMGTEGWLGHVRMVAPRDPDSACLYCWRELYEDDSRQQQLPICMLAGLPTRSEHVIGWALSLEWPRIYPQREFNARHSDDIRCLYEIASSRAIEYGIALDYETVQHMVARIIPNIVSTTALIAGMAILAIEIKAKEWQSDEQGDNFWFFNGQSGLYWTSHRLQRNPQCLVCHSTINTTTIIKQRKIY